MRKCVECSAEYDPNESYFPDTCDSCAAIIEGVDDISKMHEVEENL